MLKIGNHMDKLLALPIAGDAYLLHSQGFRILVDGGHSSLSLSMALSSPDVAARELDIVVCTHADIDHAGGLVDLLDKRHIRVGEFWLPGAWGDALPALLSQPSLVMDALAQEMENWSPDAEGPSDQDEEEFETGLHARIAAERRSLLQDCHREVAVRDPDSKESKAGVRWLRDFLADDQRLEAGDTAAAKAFDRGRRLVRHRASALHLNEQQRSMWNRTIKTAERIRQIAVQAVRQDVPVRWFDFGEFAKTRTAIGGEPGRLVPLNSIELLFPPRPVEAMSYLARLTPVNEECLVFLAEGERSRPWDVGVIFTGDSPLGFGTGYGDSFLGRNLDEIRTVVATAPHHGSESNKVAYQHMNAVARVAIWLRSGGSSRHPGPTFRGLPDVMRVCTSCPHRGHARRLAVVHLSHPDCWPVLRTNGYECNC